MKKLDVKLLEQTKKTDEEISVAIGRNKDYIARCRKSGEISESAECAIHEMLMEKPKGLLARIFKR